MTQTDILRAFLIKLGFKIDATGKQKFVDTVASMTVNAVKLGTAITAASASVTAGVAKIASGLESLHFASQRTRASVENIQAFGFAAAQMGGSAEGARASLEHLARLMRTNPGASGLLRRLGVETHDAQGQLRDTSTLLTALGERLKRMPYDRAYAYAQALGIDEKTLNALQQGVGRFSAMYRDMLRASGLDAQAAAKSSHAFMNELRLLGATAGIVRDQVAASLTGAMSADIKRLRKFLVAHFGQISKAIQIVVGWILKAAEVTSTLSIRAMQAIDALANWFNSLSGSGQNLIKVFGLMLVAWRLLSTGFMITPLGRITALAAALLLLWDDYQTWKEGGRSLIDWSRWEPAINAALDALKKLCDWLGKGAEAIGGWKTVAEVVL